MTCIVGIVHDGEVIIGGDSAGSDGHMVIQRADSKVFTVGPYVLGFTSSFRMGQLLRYRLDVEAPDTWDVDRYMATTFVDAVRECLKAGGWARTTDSDPDDKEPGGSEAGGTFLVGIHGHLYQIEDDYQVGIASDGYDACGSGYMVALGSLYATAGRDPHERVRLALEAAAHVTPFVRAPFATVVTR